MDLSLDDEIVNSAFWSRKQPFQTAEEHRLWEIINDWKAGRVSSSEALMGLESVDLLDPDSLMKGFAAVKMAEKAE